jgi:hypothetical protein
MNNKATELTLLLFTTLLVLSGTGIPSYPIQRKDTIIRSTSSFDEKVSTTFSKIYKKGGEQK